MAAATRAEGPGLGISIKKSFLQICFQLGKRARALKPSHKTAFGVLCLLNQTLSHVFRPWLLLTTKKELKSF